MGAFSSILDRILLTEDIRAYIHCKIGEVGDFETVGAINKFVDWMES